MPPQPVEDINLPAVGDKILEFLEALWEFIRSICLVVWDTISQACWAVWTWPPFEGFRNEVATVFTALFDYVTTHPIATIAIILFVLVVLPWLLEALIATVAGIIIIVLVLIMTVLNAIKFFFLECLGLTRRGALRGSYATNYQSTSYGGNVPRGSTFVQYQSQSAAGYRDVNPKR